MTEKMYYAERAKIEVAEATEDLAAARKAFEHGAKKLQADFEVAAQAFEKAKAIRDEEYDKLKAAVKKAELRLEGSRLYALKAATDAEAGFDL